MKTTQIMAAAAIAGLQPLVQRASGRRSGMLRGLAGALLGAGLLVAGHAASAAPRADAAVKTRTVGRPAPVRAASPSSAHSAGRSAQQDAPVHGPMAPSQTLGPAGKASDRTDSNGAADRVAHTSRIPGMARFRSIGTDDTVMYDAPSDKAKKLYQAPRGMPVEVIAVLQGWIKVRDMQGDIAWVQRDDLSDRRTVMARNTITLYREPSTLAMHWFDVARGVVLELQDDLVDDAGFIRVRHADGQVGYVQLDQVWGV